MVSLLLVVGLPTGQVVVCCAVEPPPGSNLAGVQHWEEGRRLGPLLYLTQTNVKTSTVALGGLPDCLHRRRQ